MGGRFKQRGCVRRRVKVKASRVSPADTVNLGVLPRERRIANARLSGCKRDKLHLTFPLKCTFRCLAEVREKNGICQ